MGLLMGILMIAGLAIVLVMGAIIAVPAAIFLDVMSYTARGSQTLSPSGAPAGRALVVYDPGFSGAAKNAAAKIAGGLQSQGYTVELAGVRSPAARNVSGYGVIVVGGPTEWDMLGRAAKSYLKRLHASPEARIGVYATGSVAPKSSDPAYMRKFVTSLPDESYVKVDAVVKLITSDDGKAFMGDVDGQCRGFVEELLQQGPSNKPVHGDNRER